MASTAALAVVATLALGAAPATSMPIDEVPEDPALWATSPYSPLPAAEISAAGNTREITFDGADGGLHDGTDVDTGFTMIQPSSANNDYYLPELLDVEAGQLTITTTKGIAYSNTGATGLINQQDNTLGVGVDVTDANLELTTTLNSPTAATSSAQAGLWFGPDDQNYVKLALIGSSSTGRQIQLSREINGLTTNGSAAAPSADQVMVDLSQTTIGTQPVTLTMTINTVNDTITGRYQIGDGAEQTLGSLALPENYHDGSLLVTPVADVTSFAGIYATKRNMPETTPLAYTFDGFSVAELDAEPPAAPEGLTASPASDAVELSWTGADVSSDVVGYRVYRGTSSPVSTAGNGLGGTALLTTPSFTDTGVFIGHNYHYAVVAEDATGNRSAGAETQATVPAVDGEPVALVNFQTAAAPTPAGYTADTGAAYDETAGSGWRSDATGAPLDLTTMTRLRTGSSVTTDQRLATIIHMQHTSATVDGEWEYDLPNGTYTVVAGVGDTSSANGGGYDSTHAINAEGTTVISPFSPSSAREYDEGVATVEVTDGSLTIDAVGGSNTKLAYVGIYADEAPPAAPAAPANLAGQDTAGGVQLTWDAVDGATGYNVYRGTEATVPTDGAPLNAEPLATPEYLDATAEAGTTYFYAVVAVGDGGSSPASPAVEVTTADEPTAPAAPADLAGEATATGVQLTWSAVPGATGYDVFRATEATVPTDGAPLNAGPLTDANYLDATAEAGTTYYYVVVASNEAGTSAPSAAAEVAVPEAPTVPAAPAGLAGESTDAGVVLTWAAADGATSYQVYRGVGTPALPEGEPHATVTEPTFTDADVVAGTTYSYVIVALNEEGASEPSNAVSVEVPGTTEPGVCTTGQWSAEYFVGTELAGEVVSRECLDELDLNWGSEGPAGAGSDYFSGRWTTTVNEGAGTYAFQVRADDGFRVLVDGELVLDKWFAQNGWETHTVEVDLTDGGHEVVVEYFENRWAAEIYADWFKVAGPGEPAVCEPGQWSAEYFLGTELAGDVVSRECLDELDLNWGSEGPAGTGTDFFSGRWTTSVDQGAGTYAFQVRADDGFRVLVDGELVLDRWVPQNGWETHTVEVDLADGAHEVVVEYFENRWAAEIHVDWFKVAGPGEPAVCEPGQWSAEYFLGTELAGDVVSRECLDELDLNWGSEGPANAGTDYFSGRWTTTVNEGAGRYAFQARGDDGFRVLVDGELVLDRWVPQNGWEVHTVEVNLTDGAHEVVVEYFENRWAAEIHADWFKLAPGEPGSCEPGTWSAEYFEGTELAGDVVSRECLFALDLNWGSEGPAGVSADYFSGRWTTTVNEGAGTYAISARADDGFRVLVDGELVLDRWAPQNGWETHTVEVGLADGPHEVVVEYFENRWAAEIHADWEKVGDGPVDTVAPEAPTALTATATASTVDLSWQASVSTDAVGYHVYRGTAPGVTTDGEPYSGATALGVTVFSDPNVTPGETYYYVVTAVDAVGNESVVSNEVEVAVEQIVAPTGLVATSGTTAIELSWTASASTGTAGYQVYRGTEAGVTAGVTPLNASPLTGTTYSDGTAEPGVTYYYVVTAVDAAGNESAVSNEATGLLTEEDDTEAPAAPADLAAAAGDGVVDLTWTASKSTDVVGYRVFRSLEPNVILTGELVSGEAPVTGTSYADTAVTNGTTYFYGVRAVDGAGNESLLSNEAFGVPRVPNDLDVKVDFGASGMTPAAGYVLDFGEAYGARTGANQGTGLTYGWVDEDGHDLSLVGNGRDRGRAGIDERLDSILHMQYGDVVGTNGVDTEGTWEIGVPDGLYEVTVAVGDEGGTNGYDSVHVINAEAGVAIEAFQATSANEYLTATTTVGVWDGRLTLSPKAGTNTKIAYVEVLGLELAPHVDTVLPDNRGIDHDVTAGVSATIRIPYAGVGVDPTTLQGNVHLFEAATGTPVPVTVGTSGGNDVISLSPDESLDGNKTYRFVVTDAVKDNFGAAFVPFTSVFTTGSGEIIGEDEFTPLTGIEFEKVELPVAANKYWASFAFGPDGKLYGTTIGQGLFRMTVNEDGTLSNLEDLGYQGRAMIGLVFDRDATADDLRLWVTSTSANIGGETQEWISGVSLLEGPNLQTEHKVFTSLPRSLTDHLTNSIAYGPDGRLYFLQGSNQAAGDLDNSWGQRGEKLLTAAALVFDQDHPQVQAATAGNAPIDVKTADGGTYDPFAAGAPLKIHATGIRNAYDLVWHSNGSLYVPTNGTAGGANSPGVTANPDGTFTRVAAAGIPGYSTVNGQDVTNACLNRRIDGEPYTGGSVPAIANHPTQQDHLYRVEEHGYYGHPNPERCEWVLHEGNDPANPPTAPGQGGSKYPSGTKADPNYRGIAYNLGFNKSPNGALEYQAETFDGQLQGRLIVTRFSNNNDLIFLQADSATGEILGAQTSEGLTGVADSTMTGVDGFNDPLEVVEDPSNGNLYVNQYNRGGSDQKLFLLRVPEEHRAPTLETSADELIFSAVKSTTSAQRSVTVTNFSTDTVTLGASLTGTNAGEFALTGTGGPLAPGASATFQVRFTPGTTVGQRSAVLRLTTGDQTVDVGLYGLTMNGIEGGNEPTLHNVVGTLGHAIDVGWTTLAGGMDPAARGDEVLEPLFVRAGSAPVTMTPLAQYAPREDLPFGWYTGDGTTAERHQVGSIDISGYQSLLPPVSPGSQTSFDPGDEEFGLYYFSNTFGRLGYTEDRLNSPASDAHRARIYPAKNRSGAAMPNTYVVAFEDASNGDYQDYVFLVSGLKPAGEAPGPVENAIKINFSNQAAALPTGYLRDFGEPFGARTRTDQGTGLSFGWKDQATENPIDLSVGGTTGPGNGRDRNTSQPDQRLDTLMHMQSADITANGNTFNGVSAYAFWEIALPDGTYQVTVAAGDPTVNSDPEEHAINVENEQLIAPFLPTGVVGADTRHRTATTEVTLTDGFLTIDANGGTNTKINYVDIVPVDVDGDDPSDGAQVKVAFGPSSAPLTDGWAREAGSAYSDERGFGWVDAATGQPVDRTVATRYRATATAGIEYPADNRLKAFAFIDNASQPAYTNGIWEYEVPNGTYEVAVSVGDAGFLDSTHGVAAEGQPVIASFVPTGTTPFQTGVRTVSVTDGKLSITNTGTNTKINWVSITGDGLDPVDPPPPGENVQIAFGPESAPLTAGWSREAGSAFAEARGFGWIDADTGQPVDRTAATRYRATATGGIAYPSDDRLKSFAFLDNATQSYTNGTWEHALGNGTYTVEVSVGDAGFLDSTHGVAVEGVELIDGFTPTGSAPFASATGTVEVTDGRLSLTNTGTNTKVNYIRIAGESLSAPSVDVTLNGVSVGSSYSGGPVEVAINASVATGTTLESLTYSVNGGPAMAYAGPFNLGVGNHVLEVTAVDSDDRTTVREVALEILDVGGTVDLTNTQVTRQGGEPVPGLSDDWLVLHKINSGLGAHKFPDTGTVTLANTGTKDLRVTDVALTGSAASSFTLGTLPATPFTLAPGQSTPVTVNFTSTSGSKGIRAAQVQITSSDAASPITTVEVRGGYMTQPEGGNELTLNQVSALYGWTTEIGTLVNGDEMRTSALKGDEVRSFQWKRMDAAKPVTARQIAAFHGCCGQTETININGATATHHGDYGQSIYPLNNALSGPTQLTTNPTGSFNLTVSGQNTANPDYMAVKTWPVIDQDGNPVAGSWIVGHDYISSPNQCGVGATNCDFQDNVYLVTNVLPVTPHDATAPTAPGGVAATVDGQTVVLDWDASTEADVAGYHVERSLSATGPWTRLTGGTPVTGTTFTDSAVPAAGTGYYRVLAVDYSGTVSTTATPVEVALPEVDEAPVRINAGGGAITLGGVQWAADTFFAGGKTYSNSQVTQIAGTTDDVLYQSERSATTNLGSFGYNIPVGGGDYVVRLHFAEIYHGATGGGAGGTGKRVFSVNLEGGTTEVANLDLNALVAPMTAYVRDVPITVTDGNLDIDFSATVDQPKISAIEVIPAG